MPVLKRKLKQLEVNYIFRTQANRKEEGGGQKEARQRGRASVCIAGRVMFTSVLISDVIRGVMQLVWTEEGHYSNQIALLVLTTYALTTLSYLLLAIITLHCFSFPATTLPRCSCFFTYFLLCIPCPYSSRTPLLTPGTLPLSL